MTSKRPLIYLGIAILVAVVVFLIERPDLPMRGDVSDEPTFPQYDAREVTRIEVQQLLSGVQLKKEGDDWFVSDMPTSMRKELLEKEGKSIPQIKWFPADRSVVGSALGVFGDFPEGMIVSTNPDEQMIYQVRGPLALTVKMYKGNEKEVDVAIGKRSPDFSGNYVRVGDSNEVRLFERVIETLYPTSVPAWRDHTIWRVSPSMLDRVDVDRIKDSFAMARNEEGDWVLIQPKTVELDQEKVKNFLNQLSYIRANGFASEGDPMSKFKRAELKLTLALRGGSSEVLEVGGSNNLGQSYARREGDSQTYLMTKPDVFIPESWEDLR